MFEVLGLERRIAAVVPELPPKLESRNSRGMRQPPDVMRSPGKRRAARALGILLIAVGLGLIRAAPIVRARTEATPLGRVLLHESSGRDLVLRKLPETFPTAFAVLVAGALLVGWVAPRRVRCSREEGPPTDRPETRAARLGVLMLVVAAPLASLVLFGVLSSRKLMLRPAVVVPFALLVAFAVAGAAWISRLRKVRIGASVSCLEAIFLLLGTLAVLALQAHGLNSWKYSFVGDEWAFHASAVQLNEWGPARIPWLDAHGVYNQFPVMVSAWQALWIGLVPGPTNVGWRFANTVLMASCFVPLYLTLRHLLGHAVPRPHAAAAVGAICFCLSEFIVVWGRMGYSNASFVPPLVFAGAFHFAARARGSNLHHFLGGIVCGLGTLLSVLGALPMAVLSGMFVLDFLLAPAGQRSIRRDVLLPFAFLLSGFLLAAAPILFQWDYWKVLIDVNLTSQEAHEHRQLVFAKTIQSFFSFLSYGAHGHFMYGNAIDPITGFLVAAGLAMPRLLGRRTWGDLLFVLLAIAFLAGGISQYSYPPVTRMMLIMYPVALLAAAGFAGLTSGNAKGSIAGACVLVAVIGAYNLLKVECWNPYKNTQYLQLHEIRRIQESPPGRLHALVLPKHERGFLVEMSYAYGLADRIVTFEDDASRYDALFEFLTKSRGGHVEVRLLRSSPNVEEVRARAQAAGVRFGPLIEDGIPPLNNERDRWIFPFFEALNP
jgi:hypothetical protein